MAKFYITTAIPYVNAAPHIGHALEFIQADVIARFHRQKGEEVLLLSGSDENAIKNVQAAEQAGVPVQQFIDKNAQLFYDLAKTLGVQFDVFQKGSVATRQVIFINLLTRGYTALGVKPSTPKMSLMKTKNAQSTQGKNWKRLQRKTIFSSSQSIKMHFYSLSRKMSSRLCLFQERMKCWLF